MKKHRWLILGLTLLVLGGAWLFRSRDRLPEPVFRVQTPFFSDKHVMVLVPHQDDEVCLAGGIIEQYTKAGSRVSLVYATNGDYNALAEERSREALAAAAVMGIPKEDVYYLGYGNQWQPQDDGSHIYFAADGDGVWTSHFGATETYGTTVIGPWRQSAYTRNNFLRDLTDLILELRPDVIYCNDYDPHHDHMALDLFFEEAMGNILQMDLGYHPAVYKGLAYGTAWHAEADFAGAENLHASRMPDWDHWGRMGIPYDWDSRVRLPMGAENLSPILSENTVFRALSCFQSQGAWQHAQQVLNGDKVFFERRTDSLLYDAVFYGGSEQVTVWNDFKLKDSEEFSGLTNSGWDFNGSITVRLPEPVQMNEIRLHTDPGSDSIWNGYIRFSDGSREEFRVLTAKGVGVISFPARTVSSFDILSTAIYGEKPKVTEIEAFDRGEEQPLLLMAVDENDDFAYDYQIPAGDTACFRLYTYPMDSLKGWADVQVGMEGSWGCKWALDPDLGELRVTCPPAGRAVITVTAADGVSTTFTVSNPLPQVRQDRLDRQKADLAAIMAQNAPEE